MIPLAPVWLAVKAGFSGLFKILAKVPWQAWVLIGTFLLGVFVASAHYRGKISKLKADHAVVLDELAKKTEAARVAAKRAESAQAGAIATAIDKFREGQKNAKQTGASVTAGLNDGSVKLREHWQGCPKHLPTAAAGSERSDEGARLRAASAGRVVATGADADAQVTALQAIIRSAPHCFKVGD